MNPLNKMPMLFLFATCLFIGLGAAPAKESSYQLPLEQGETAYEVNNQQVIVNDNLIHEILIGKDRFVVTCENRGDENASFKGTLRFYNAQGLLLGETTFDNAGGIFVPAHNVATKRIYIQWYPLKQIFDRSQIKPGNDCNIIKWVVYSKPAPKK